MKTARLIAFHLPQYHPIPENDAWWGAGFTEWTNVVKARPQYEGHYQPHLPADLGFYDLRLPEARAAQAELAQAYGIEGFCYYYYWFGGKRLLERPIEAMLADRAPDMPFCLCWANENWTRRWNGNEHDVLMAQQHSPEDDEAMMRDVARYFADPRYIRVDGRPVLLVYRLDVLPDPAATVARWRAVCAALGVGDPYLCAVQSYGVQDPSAFGFDAAIEFPPHGVVSAEVTGHHARGHGFRGRILSYEDTVRYVLAKPKVGYARYRGVMPSWDNTARKPNFGHCYQGSHPLVYRAWLAAAVEEAKADATLAAPFVFINAWNEWGEGCHLEPDQRYGHDWLRATQAALTQGPAPAPVLDALLAGARPSSGETLPDAQWATLDLSVIDDAPQITWRSRQFMRVRFWVNQRPALKRMLRPIARLAGLVD
ncbi:MAG: glycoside hydrolase family 99-like domain-containing protein [Burkholderiales bacterium]|nr:glycoside hydrolase family 99-like domain-containing protein [Burkholderiales bacterium]